MIYMMIYMMIL